MAWKYEFHLLDFFFTSASRKTDWNKEHKNFAGANGNEESRTLKDTFFFKYFFKILKSHRLKFSFIAYHTRFHDYLSKKLNAYVRSAAITEKSTHVTWCVWTRLWYRILFDMTRVAPKRLDIWGQLWILNDGWIYREFTMNI